MDPRDYAIGARWSASLPPGVYERVVTPAAPRDVRMDVAAFIGLTERGPVGVAVPVDSWSELLAWFGQPGGGRLLPQCLQLFFANGGRRAVVVRAMDYVSAIAARFRLEGVGDGAAPLEFEARDPGAWGDRLRIEWQWVQGHTQNNLKLVATWPDRLELTSGRAPPIGTLLRRTRKRPPVDAPVLHEDLAYVTGIAGKAVLLDAPFPALVAGEVAGPIEEVRATLRVTLDGQVQTIPSAMLHPDHREGLQRLLSEDPRSLVRLVAGQFQSPIRPITPLLGGTVWARPLAAVRIRDGYDAADTTSREHFFAAPARGVALDDDHLFRGQPAPFVALHAYDDLHETEPVSLVCLPDLLHPTQAVGAASDVSVLDSTTRFSPCEGGAPPVDNKPVSLDYPLLSATFDPAAADARQAELVELCAYVRPGAGYGRVAVLDPRPGLDANGIVVWRMKVASDAGLSVAYAPWLECAPAEDPTGAILVVPPCGAACGVIARQERLAGVHAAPANALVAGIVRPRADPLLPDPRFLHEERVNLIRATESGVKVMGSRTTSFDGDWTHLPVRRLMHYLCRQIDIDTRWAVFEPHNALLWRRLTLSVERRLTALYRANAFAGATPQDSWFVRCDGTVNPPSVQDVGQVVTLVGVAPAVPAEFLVFRIALQRDGAAIVEELDG